MSDARKYKVFLAKAELQLGEFNDTLSDAEATAVVAIISRLHTVASKGAAAEPVLLLHSVMTSSETQQVERQLGRRFDHATSLSVSSNSLRFKLRHMLKIERIVSSVLLDTNTLLDGDAARLIGELWTIHRPCLVIQEAGAPRSGEEWAWLDTSEAPSELPKAVLLCVYPFFHGRFLTFRSRAQGGANMLREIESVVGEQQVQMVTERF